MVMTLSKERVWELLSQVTDPEIPVLNIVEMGIVRDVSIQNGSLKISITPTYSGCPAMHAIEQEIRSELRRAGFDHAEIRTIFAPPWTTDWLTDHARQKLKDYGIAPPSPRDHKDKESSSNWETQSCPYCDSPNTELRSPFGSTACKALHYCNACQQPFESFKCI